jgi:outer membrane protein TolC
MKKILRTFLAIGLLSIPVPIMAQRPLTLDDAIAIAFEKGLEALSEKNRLEAAQTSYRAIQLGQRPSVQMDLVLPAYAKSLNSYFDPLTGHERFFSVGNTTVEGSLSISQPIQLTNGQITFFGSLFGRNQVSEISGKTRDYFSSAYISLSQPLFGFNDRIAAAKRAKIRLDQAERDYAQARMDIIYAVTSRFYGLLKSKRSMEIMEERVGQIERSYETASNKFKAGLIAEVEAMELEVDLALSRNEMFNAKTSFEELKDDFKQFLGLGLDEPLDVTASLEFAPVQVTLEEAVRDILANRADYQNAKSDIALDELGIRELRAQNAIQASVNASYGINRNDDRFSGVFRNLLESRRITLNLSVPVFDWGRNKKLLEQAKADLRLEEIQLERMEQSILREVKSAIGDIQSAAARIRLLGKSVEVAQKSFDIKSERFANGAITSFELSQAQLKLTDTKLSVMNALIDYEIAKADLGRKTLRRY